VYSVLKEPIPRWCRNRRHFPPERERDVLIGPPKRKLPACLEHRIFAVSKRKPAFGQRSTKGAAIRIFLEPIWDRPRLAYRQRQVLNSSRTGFLLLALNHHLANGATDNKDSDGGGNGNTGSRVHDNRVIALDSVGTKAKSPNAARIGQRNVFIRFTFYNAHLYWRCGFIRVVVVIVF
jgi:hypothetical protein